MSDLTQLQIKNTLLELAGTVGGREGKLIASFAELLELQFSEVSNEVASMSTETEKALIHHLELLQAEVTNVKTMLVSRLNSMDRVVDDQNMSMRQKLHSVSNFIMSLETKIDELAALLTDDNTSEES